MALLPKRAGREGHRTRKFGSRSNTSPADGTGPLWFPIRKRRSYFSRRIQGGLRGLAQQGVRGSFCSEVHAFQEGVKLLGSIRFGWLGRSRRRHWYILHITHVLHHMPSLHEIGLGGVYYVLNSVYFRASSFLPRVLSFPATFWLFVSDPCLCVIFLCGVEWGRYTAGVSC